MRILYFSLFVLLFSYGCKKSEIEQIPSNEPPPDNTVSSVTIENYITRVYILTLGREPDSTEFETANTLLKNANLDSTSRRVFLNSVFSDADYRPHVYQENKDELLDFVDTTEFGHMVYIFNLILSDTSYQSQWPSWQYERDRMVLLSSAYNDFIHDSIDIAELHKRLCDNHFYDELHMGSANFVDATFSDLIGRNPTVSEEQSGIDMVDGQNSVLFFQAGSSKDDYLNIFINSNNYFEGQVIFMYKKYLNRVPNTVEMAEGTTKYSTTHDYTAVQKDILATDEFINL